MLVQKLKHDAHRQKLTRLIATFDDVASPVRNILHHHWKVLLIDPDIGAYIGQVPQITCRHEKSLERLTG